MKFNLSHSITALSMVIATMLLAACGGAEEGHVVIKGYFKHLQQATLFVYNDSPTCTKYDTIQVINGEFEHDCQVSEPTVMTIVYPNFTDMVFLAEPTTELEYEADVSDLRHASLTGTEANDSLTNFRQRYATESLATQQKAAENYIRKRPEDLASIALFAQYFERADKIKKEPASSLLLALKKAHPKNTAVRAMCNRMEAQLQTAIGAKTSEELLSRKALYIFTLSSQYSSNDLRRVAEECTSDSIVKLVEVCLDTLDIHSARMKYGLRYIPGNLLIDAEGCIVDRDVPGDRLREVVETLKKP